MEKRSYNLCSAYILPMVGVNRFSFGSSVSAFKNSYLSTDDRYVVVETTKPYSSSISSIPTFRFKFERDGCYLAVFEIPESFKDDVLKFKEGRYSKFKESTKDQIRRKSGLNYKVPIPGGGVRSARELLALEKDKDLREALERELSNPGSPIRISKEAELASVPGPENYYDLKLSTELQETI